MRKILLLFWTLFGLTLSVSAQDAQEKIENQYANIPAIDYCEIIKNPNLYSNKIVKISAEYSAGFERSMLGSQVCKDDYGQIWAEWEKFQSCGDAKTAKLLENRAKRIEYTALEGNFVGRFFVKQGRSGFGHMNARSYKLVISCVENAVLVPKEDLGCRRIDETDAFHFLEYAKTEFEAAPNYKVNSKSTKKEKIVWLRLVNNSSCPIIVPTAAKESTTLENNAKVLVAYNLTGKIISGDSILFSKKPDKPITNEKPVPSILPAGSSIYFGVPLRYFKESFKVWRNLRNFWNASVPFNYADRQATEGYEPFYFSGRDLPEELWKK